MFMQSAARFIPSETALPLPSVRTGLIAATLVESDSGWRPAGTLRVGDRVHSFDGGLRDIVAVHRDWLMPGTVRLVHVDGGRLGCASDTILLPDQLILIDTWDALPDAVVALAPAASAVGAGATFRSMLSPLEVVTLVFDDEEVIYVNSGMLLHCPANETGQAGFYPRLDRARAHALLQQASVAGH
jgi:hypothetical protein